MKEAIKNYVIRAFEKYVLSDRQLNRVRSDDFGDYYEYIVRSCKVHYELGVIPNKVIY